MRYLYLDNFRGFTNTTVPLKDVNFLVGENSTGKTSFLTMLRMFSGPHLFMGPEGGDELQLGHFNEMVSAHSADPTYFHLGIAGEPESGKDRRGFGLLLTYRPVNGLARISRLTCTIQEQEVCISFEGGKISYRAVKVPPAANATEMHKRLLGWVRDHSGLLAGDWKQVALPSGMEVHQFPVFVILAMATQEGLNKKISATTKSVKKPKDTKQEPRTFNFAFPNTLPPIVWIAPIRAKLRRTYDEPQTTFSPEGAHIPYVIKRMLGSKKEAQKFSEFIERIGESSGLFQKIEIKHFGDTSTSPFEVDAFVDDKALSLGWLGYGVSQSLPIFVELLDRRAGSWFAIQQPEVHLHPRAQACLGDVFFEMAMRDGKRFLVETHSDFTIDRFRLNYRNKRSKKDQAKVPEGQILFFERQDKHNVVTPIAIGRGGELPAKQPESYRQFFIKEEMRVLGSR